MCRSDLISDRRLRHRGTAARAWQLAAGDSVRRRLRRRRRLLFRVVARADERGLLLEEGGERMDGALRCGDRPLEGCGFHSYGGYHDGQFVTGMRQCVGAVSG